MALCVFRTDGALGRAGRAARLLPCGRRNNNYGGLRVATCIPLRDLHISGQVQAVLSVLYILQTREAGAAAPRRRWRTARPRWTLSV